MSALDRTWFDGQVAEYAKLRLSYERFADVLLRVLQGAVRDLGLFAVVQARAKTTASFAEKIIRKRNKYVDPVNQLGDLCGARVIASTKEQVAALREYIEGHFEIAEGGVEDVLDRLGPQEFSYTSIHLAVAFRPGVFPDVPDLLFERFEPGHPTMRGPRFRAEIQVRTFLQHAWAEVVHDAVYKSGIEVPRRWKRDLARIAALLEEGDELFIQAARGLREYSTHFGVYMKPDAMRDEIETLETVLRHDPRNAGLAHRAGRLHMELKQWPEAEAVLSTFEGQGKADIERELGVARLRMGRREGRANLERAVALDAGDADALCELAESWAAENPARALELHRRAFEAAPTHPRALAGYVEARVCHDRSLEFIPLLRPSLEAAIARCRAWLDVGVNLPYALFHAAELALLLCPPSRREAASPDERWSCDALSRYCLAILLSPTEEPIRAALATVEKLQHAVGDQLPQLEWARRLLRLGVVGKLLALPREAGGDAKAAEAACDELLQPLATGKALRFDRPVIYVAGGCDPGVQQRMEEHRGLIHAALAGFSGAIVSAGTKAGIGGIVGDLPAPDAGVLQRIGYLPKLMPADGLPHPAYEHRFTDGVGFTALEPLQSWIDLLASGVRPADVKILGVNGGAISGFEFRLALALGAPVGVLRDSGREASRISDDPDWSEAAGLAPLPSDVESLRAFIHAGGGSSFDPASREVLAMRSHDEYRASQKERIKKLDAALADWQNLPEALMESNRRQVDDIERKLVAGGLKLRKVEAGKPAAFEFTPEEIERLAEMEHGRWNAERLLAGWRPGPRDHAARKSPYLVPWRELPENIKEYDRAAVRAIPGMLAGVGYEIHR